MKRRAAPDEVEVPTWVLESRSITAAMRELGAMGVGERELDPRLVLAGDGWSQEPKNTPMARLCALRRSREEAGRAWCAERNLSFQMTVLGWPRPSAEEITAGCTRGAGAYFAEKERLRAEYRAGRRTRS